MIKMTVTHKNYMVFDDGEVLYFDPEVTEMWIPQIITFLELYIVSPILKLVPLRRNFFLEKVVYIYHGFWYNNIVLQNRRRKYIMYSVEIYNQFYYSECREKLIGKVLELVKEENPNKEFETEVKESTNPLLKMDVIIKFRGSNWCRTVHINNHLEKIQAL